MHTGLELATAPSYMTRAFRLSTLTSVGRFRSQQSKDPAYMTGRLQSRRYHHAVSSVALEYQAAGPLGFPLSREWAHLMTDDAPLMSGTQTHSSEGHLQHTDDGPESRIAKSQRCNRPHGHHQIIDASGNELWFSTDGEGARVGKAKRERTKAHIQF